MSVSIATVVPAYNSEPFLRGAVQSLWDTGYDDLRVIVVDDGSTDGTLTVAQQLAQREPRLQVVRHPGGVRAGVSASRNLGLRHVGADLVAFLDADDTVLPNRFDAAVRQLADDPGADGVHGLTRLQFDSDAARRSWPSKSQLFGFAEPIAPENLLASLLTGVCWATSAILFRRPLLERSGLFPVGVAVAEDCHLWFRMAYVGRLLSGAGHPVSVYRRREGSAYTPGPRNRLHMIRAMADFLAWLKKRGAPSHDRHDVQNRIAAYIQSGLIAARSHRDLRLARAIAITALRSWPSLSLNHRFQRQLMRIGLESVWRPAEAVGP